jgi:DNA-nicking Smr family endonuclease
MTGKRRRKRRDPPDSGDLLDARPLAQLDLHGFTADEARAAVRNFVSAWQRRASGKVVYIITGRGRSGSKPVLRSIIARLLAGELAVLVSPSGMVETPRL